MFQERVNEVRAAMPASWRQAIARYQSPDVRSSVWQLVNTFVPYAILWYLMVRSLSVSYWLTLGLAVISAGFLMRIFIFFHDAGHGSFFRSRRANDVVGIITGVLTFTPYYSWRHAHNIHHATASDLDRRGIGDVWTMTLKEYREASPWRRLGYRAFRFPPVTFLIGPVFIFLVLQRFPGRGEKGRELSSVYFTDLALLGIAALAYFTIGLKAYLLIQLPVMAFAGMAGVWMFYVQHQFEGTYWEHHDKWDYTAAALVGSSYYRLPAVLRWFTGSIGYHHVHHLSPRIPNYKLKQAYEGVTVLQQVPAITMLTSLQAVKVHLWDEERQRMVGFGSA